MQNQLKAGAATADLTPRTSQFLMGYPHVERMSTGAHDPLLSSALYLESDGTRVMLIGNDIVFIPNSSMDRIRGEIARRTAVPPGHILVSATHTHSGPKVSGHPFMDEDPVIPPIDPAYVRLLEDGIIAAGVGAAEAARPAVAGLGRADSTGIGTNRHIPTGPSDHEVPVLSVRDAGSGEQMALMLVCSMHPTVMHEDSKLVSADFPGMSRQYLQRNVTGESCVIAHHTGCAGNQSPRHVTQANTFEESERIGAILGRAVEQCLPGIDHVAGFDLAAASTRIDPPRREFPSVQQSETELAEARARFEALQRSGPRQEARTAECDVFGAEFRLRLSRFAAAGELEAAYAACTPAEVQVVKIGPWCFAGWPCETYVEYALELKKACADSFVIALTNGHLHGYVTTLEAVEFKWYEAGTAMFDWTTGALLVDTTRELIAGLRA